MVRVKYSFLIIMIIICFSSRALALAPETHSAINKQIAQELFLDGYLKNQLGLSDGKDTFFNSKKVFDLVADGGENEDSGIRSLNHFLNPITNQGLSGQYSAVNWATLSVGSQQLENYSWNDLRSYYYTALTSKDKTTRDTYFVATFQGVGQVMHLVQDMSVPAHTRNDKHPSILGIGGDDYENWVRSNSAGYSAYASYSPYSASFLIPQLFDTDQYNGSNPEITTQPTIGLAEYTNANFLSQDTIFSANSTYCVFRSKSATDSVSNRPPNPEQTRPPI